MSNIANPLLECNFFPCRAIIATDTYAVVKLKTELNFVAAARHVMS